MAGDNIAAFCSDVLTISIFSGSSIYPRTLGVNRNTTWMECKSIPEHHALIYSHPGSIHEDGRTCNTLHRMLRSNSSRNLLRRITPWEAPLKTTKFPGPSSLFGFTLLVGTLKCCKPLLFFPLLLHIGSSLDITVSLFIRFFSYFVYTVNG